MKCQALGLEVQFDRPPLRVRLARTPCRRLKYPYSRHAGLMTTQHLDFALDTWVRLRIADDRHEAYLSHVNDDAGDFQIVYATGVTTTASVNVDRTTAGNWYWTTQTINLYASNAISGTHAIEVRYTGTSTKPTVHMLALDLNSAVFGGANGYANADADENANANIHANPDAHANANQNADAGQHAYADAHNNSIGNTDNDQNADANQDANGTPTPTRTPTPTPTLTPTPA